MRIFKWSHLGIALAKLLEGQNYVVDDGQLRQVNITHYEGDRIVTRENTGGEYSGVIVWQDEESNPTTYSWTMTNTNILSEEVNPSTDDAISNDGTVVQPTRKQEVAVEEKLYRFTESLAAPPMYRQFAIQSADKVFEKLQKHSKHKLLTKHLGGSLGKQTDVLEPDLDFVIIVDDLDTPEYAEVLAEFEGIIRKHHRELEIQEATIVKNKRFSVQFTFNSGVEVDLLPSANLEPEEIYSRLEKNPENYYHYSSSLAGKQIAFMEANQCAFVRNLSRALKLWYKSRNFGFDKRGLIAGSTIMELISIAAVKEMEEEALRGMRPSTLCSTFERAIDMIQNIEKLKLCFVEVNPGRWRHIAREMYPDVDAIAAVPHYIGTEQIWERPRFIVDPANPYNDLLGNQDPEAIKLIQEFASATKSHIANTTDSNGRNLTFSDVMKLFEPEPLEPVEQENPSVVIPEEIRIHFEQTPLCYPKCHKTVRNETPLKTKGVEKLLDTIQKQLVFLIHSALSDAACFGCESEFNVPVSNEEVVKKVSDFLKLKFNREIESGKLCSHDATDVTLNIPFSNDGVCYSMKCSMNWKK